MSDITLLEFRAGKMNFDGKKVAPDKRQGVVSLRITADENLVVGWREFSATMDEDALVVTSDEGKFERVQAAKTGRVYVFKIENERKFYWSQEADEVKENDLIAKFNSVLAGEDDGEEFMHQDDQHELQQLYQPLGDWPERQMDDMPEDQREILQWMLQAMGTEEAPLENLITRDLLDDLINSDQPQLSDDLKDLLPDGQGIREVLLSPQFRQALTTFGSAVNSEDGSDILYATLGLEPAEGDENRGAVEAFLHALNRKFGSQ
jgi:26S proteasome regulatory subunit N13